MIVLVGFPMKKLILILSFVLFLITFFRVEAQSKYHPVALPYYSYGLKAGVNIASQSSDGNSPVDVSWVPGFNAGGYGAFFFKRAFAVQAEIQISRKGSHWKDYFDDVADYVTYIDVPILLRYQPMKYYNLHIGPQAGYRLRAVQKDFDTGIKTDIKYYYRDFDFGLVAGAEVNLPAKINITVRYVLGILPATSNLEYIDPWRNNFIQISAGYKFSPR